MPVWSARLLKASVAKDGDSFDESSLPPGCTFQQVQRNKPQTPWLVPAEETVQLLFFHKVFQKLLEHHQVETDGEQGSPPGVPLLLLQRAVSRLFLVIECNRTFDATRYDLNGDGTVGWWEICLLWKEEQLSVTYSKMEMIYLTLESPYASRLGRIVSLAVLLTISFSAGSFIVSTLPSMQEQPCPSCEPQPFAIFDLIDIICVVLFTIEYLLRLLVSAYMRRELNNDAELIQYMCTEELVSRQTKLQRIYAFVFAWPNLIDLAAIVPSYAALPFQIETLGGHQDTSGTSSDENSSHTTMALLKLIRLMRIVRAFRLGRRFEAVIIIGRAMYRSGRAIWVLVLNLALGILIFGAMIFFCETSDYDPIRQQFVRPGSWVLVNGTYEREIIESPFLSIPQSFWWGLVTASTVGYGDDYPTTVPGKITAGICMVWSLCVLALPIGVVGSNFSRVWQEYDNEKRMATEMSERAHVEVKKTLGSIDPLSLSRRLVLEVSHDSCMATQENDIFIGEAEIELEITPQCFDPVHRQLRVELKDNPKKSKRKITGDLQVSYKWTPSSTPKAGMELEGELEITVVSARGLVAVDWKGSGLSDPYVTMTLYPNSPMKDGSIEPEVVQTKTVKDQPDPIWNDSRTFRFEWHGEGVLARREFERRTTSSAATLGFGGEELKSMDRSLSMKSQNLKTLTEVCPEESPLEEEASLLETVPILQKEVMELRRALPALRAELRTVRDGAQEIMGLLGIKPLGPLPPLGSPLSQHTNEPNPPPPKVSPKDKRSNKENLHVHIVTVPGTVLEECTPSQGLCPGVSRDSTSEESSSPFNRQHS